ncbi:MAG: hypothetical protein JWP59_2872 [Massilia sp.]|jgi:hypothetical protein|nr:hypothetical protein [Massilia sp.]
MHKPASPSRHRQLIALAIFVAVSSTVLGCRERSAPAAPAASTAAATSKAQAIERLMALPELKAWSAAIEKASAGSAHGAVIEYDQAPRLIDGQRYYQLSFVENGKDAVHRWEDFLVAEKDGAILVDDGASDKVMSLEQWRAAKRPMERVR